MTEPQKLWLAALRSGKYNQVKSVLKSLDGYCCLGVACEISRQGSFNSINRYVAQGESRGTELPQAVAKWLDLRTSIGHYPTNNGTVINSLVDLNDSGKLTFSEIADFIEQNAGEIFNEPAR